jgi:hypothetical protein
MVHLKLSLEDSLTRAFGPDAPRFILCHRWTLDPLAFWQQRGWLEEEFSAFMRTTLEDHYRRYVTVIYLVTSANGVPWAYMRWPQVYRPEEVEDAIRLDRWLQRAWGGHPNHFRIDNEGRDWPAKSRGAREILARLLEQNPLTVG